MQLTDRLFDMFIDALQLTRHVKR